MVRLATSILAASLLAVPALAVSSEQYERSVAENDLYGRDFVDVEETIATREELDEIFDREFLDELEVRDPSLFGMVAKFASKGIAKGVGKAAKSKAEHGGKGGAVKTFGKTLHRANRLSEGFNNFNGNGGGGGFSQSGFQGGISGFQGFRRPSFGGRRIFRRDFDDEDLELRGFEEDLESREPVNIGALVKVGKHLAHHAHHAQNIAQYIPQGNNNNNNDNNYGREFDEELLERDDIDEELLEREFDDEELLEREFDDEELLEREFDDEELLEREFDNDELLEREDFDDLD